MFISYKRSESWPVAEQLWEELSQRGFDVFLDKFDIEVGADFQKRLVERLTEISFIVLLETPGAKESEWVRRELAHARDLNLGLLLLNWPSTQYRFQAKGVHNVSRKKLTGAEFRRAKGGKILRGEALLEVG